MTYSKLVPVTVGVRPCIERIGLWLGLGVLGRIMCSQPLGWNGSIPTAPDISTREKRVSTVFFSSWSHPPWTKRSSTTWMSPSGIRSQSILWPIGICTVITICFHYTLHSNSIFTIWYRINMFFFLLSITMYTFIYPRIQLVAVSNTFFFIFLTMIYYFVVWSTRSMDADICMFYCFNFSLDLQKLPESWNLKMIDSNPLQ